MMFGFPWAFVGLAAIAVPILIHALTRHRATPTPFPTLRFVPASALTVVRRHRPTDPLLLLLRCAVLAAGVVGLAQPYFLTASRVRGADARLTRAIVIDTSRSMERPAADGRSAVVLARESARQLAPAAGAEQTIEAQRVADGIVEAAAWLETMPGRHEIVVVSDFQRGSLAESDLIAIDRDTAIRFVRVGASAQSSASAPPARVGDRGLDATMTFHADRTDIVWTLGGPPSVVGRRFGFVVQVLSGDAERAIAEASMAAALARGVPAATPPNPIAIVLPGAPDREALLKSAADLDAPWMFDVFHRVARDPLVAELSERDARRQPVTAKAARLGGVPTLLLFVSGADGLLAASVISAAMRAASSPSPLTELEPLVIDEATLAQWADPNGRPSSRRDVRPPAGESDGRWFWVLALVLLAIETLARRRQLAVVFASHSHAIPDPRTPIPEPRSDGRAA